MFVRKIESRLIWASVQAYGIFIRPDEWIVHTTTYTDSGMVKPTRTAFEIIETLAREDGSRVTDIAAELGLAKSTVHRHLLRSRNSSISSRMGTNTGSASGF